MRHAAAIFAWVLLIVVLAVGVARAEAPGDGPRGDRAESILKRVQEKLKLTPEQVSQIRPIVSEWKEARKARLQGMRSQLMEILTDEQKAKLEEMKGQVGAGREEGGRQGGLRKVLEALNLTDEQKERLKESRRKMMSEAQADRQQYVARVKAVLTPAQQEQLEEMIKRWRQRQECRQK